MSDIKDIDLWKEYTKTVEKIENSNREIPALVNVKQSIKSHNLRRNNKIDSAIFEFDRKNFSHLSVIQLNKQERKKFRGEATIDLHGYTREINRVLERFCSRCLVTNVRNVVIITGKGEGIVKEAVRTWILNNPKFTIGYFEIKDSAGGSGAFGIRLRSL